MMVLVAVMVGVMGLISLIAGLGVSFLGGLIAGVGDAASSAAAQSGSTQAQQAAQQAENTGNLVMVLGLIQLVTAVIKFVGVYGVFKAKSWAFYLLAGTFAFDVLQNVAGFVGVFGWTSGFGIFGILVFAMNAAILGLLLMNQSYFGVNLFGGSSQPARA
jgi:hypothetical protein